MDGPLHPVKIHLGETLCRGRGRHLLETHTGIAQQRQSRLFVLIIRTSQPNDTGVMKQLEVPAFLMLFPNLERADRHLHVGPVRPVGRANDARFPTRAGA